VPGHVLSTATTQVPGGTPSLVFNEHLHTLLFSFSGVGWDWVHLVRRPLTGLLYQPRMADDECGAVGGMKIDNGNRSTLREPAPVPLCPPQIPHYLTWARTRAAAVGSRRLTAWAMARPPWTSFLWDRAAREWTCSLIHRLCTHGALPPLPCTSSGRGK
jgi:hypothetical protein